jgi:hypothetical protein
MLRSSIIPALILALVAKGQSDTHLKLATYELGFSLNGTCFVYTVLNDSVIKSDPIGKKAFIMEASGAEISRADPGGVDLFKEYNVAECGVVMDSVSGESFYLCSILDDLWKLANGSASDGSNAFGWSASNFQPGDGQQRILNAYRPRSEIHWLGPYFGERAFRLLHDMQDPDWVARYRSAQ